MGTCSLATEASLGVRGRRMAFALSALALVISGGSAAGVDMSGSGAPVRTITAIPASNERTAPALALVNYLSSASTKEFWKAAGFELLDARN